MNRILLSLLLLSGCSLQKGNFTQPVNTIDLEIVNKEACPVSWNRANEYYSSHGIKINETEKAYYKLICVASPNIIYSLLVPSVRGVAGGRVAWASDRTKVILHELGHLIFKFPHTYRGIMTPFEDFTFLATGFADEQLESMRKQQTPFRSN
jgi:hypothetical protein